MPVNTLISKSNSLVACSTGPLHLAGVLGVKSIGLFSSKPIHRVDGSPWEQNQPRLFSIMIVCLCKGKSCNCIENISLDRVLEKLIN